MPQDLTYVIGTPSREEWQVVEVSGTYSVLQGGTVILADSTGGAFSVNLPAAADNLDRVIVVKRMNAGANTITIDPNGSETIDGVATHPLTTQYDTIMIISDGSNWSII